MYYITKKDSDTGKKFMDIVDKIKEASNAAKEEAIRLGAEKFTTDSWHLAGGLTGIILPNRPDNKDLILRKSVKVKNLYVPNRKSKSGRELETKWQQLPVVGKNELNNIINHDDPFSNIGFNYNHPEYIAFSIMEEWNVTTPDDCEEVTTTKYKEMFNVTK